jgi:MarR family transcriptional regulator for hemolysin
MARSYRAGADQALAELNLSQATAWPVLIIMRLGEGVRQRALAEELGIEAPSLVRLLDQLETSGLVQRKDDPEDGRAKTLHLTATGRHIAVEIEDLLVRFRRRLFANVSSEEADTFLRVFAALKTELECVGITPPVKKADR